MLYGWEGNRRSVAALATCNRLGGISTVSTGSRPTGRRLTSSSDTFYITYILGYISTLAPCCGQCHPSAKWPMSSRPTHQSLSLLCHITQCPVEQLWDAHGVWLQQSLARRWWRCGAWSGSINASSSSSSSMSCLCMTLFVEQDYDVVGRLWRASRCWTCDVVIPALLNLYNCTVYVCAPGLPSSIADSSRVSVCHKYIMFY